MVKPARVAGERVGTRESIGRRSLKMPTRLSAVALREGGSARRREMDGQAREGSG